MRSSEEAAANTLQPTGLEVTAQRKCHLIGKAMQGRQQNQCLRSQLSVQPSVDPKRQRSMVVMRRSSLVAVVSGGSAPGRSAQMLPVCEYPVLA